MNSVSSVEDFNIDIAYGFYKNNTDTDSEDPLLSNPKLMIYRIPFYGYNISKPEFSKLCVRLAIEYYH